MFLTWRAALLRCLVFALFYALSNAQLEAKISCSTVLHAQTSSVFESGIFGTRETWLLEEVIPDIKAHSKFTKGRIIKANNAGKKPSYDYVIVGSGPHGAQMALSLKQTDPSARILIVEAKDAPGVFAQYSGSFSINTGRDGTNISGGAVTAEQMANTQNRYLSARTIGNLTWLSHHVANADLIFDSKVTEKGIKRLNPEGDPPRYEVNIDGGLKVDASNVVIATGLGEPSIRVADVESQRVISQLQQQKDANGISKVTVVDDLLPALSRQAETHKHSAIQDMKDEEVLVVGAGDGGRIAVQALSGLSEPLNRTLKDSHKVKKVIFMGENAKSPEEFEESLAKQGKKARYGILSQEMGPNGVIENLGFKLSRVENDTASGRIKVFWKDESGKEQSRLVDRIVFATGYENKANTLFDSGTSETVKSIELKQDMSGCTNFSECRGTQVVGNQLHTGNNPENVYLAGNASTVYPSASQWDEAKNLNDGGFLAMLSERTRVMALNLARQNAKKSPYKTEVITETQPISLLIEKRENSPERDLSSELSEVVFRTELAKSLLGVNITGDLELVNAVNFSIKETDRGIHVSTLNVANESLLRPLATDPRFVRTVEDYARSHLVPGTEARISIPIQLVGQSTSEGVLNFANTKINLMKSTSDAIPDFSTNPEALFSKHLVHETENNIRENIDTKKFHNAENIYTYFDRYGRMQFSSSTKQNSVPQNIMYVVESSKAGQDLDYQHEVKYVNFSNSTNLLRQPDVAPVSP